MSSVPVHSFTFIKEPIMPDKKFPPKDQNTGKDKKDKFDVEEIDKELEDVSGGSCNGCDSCSGGPGTGCKGCGTVLNQT